MIIIWIVLIAVVSAIAYFLAKKSLRFYLESPDANIPYGIFLVRSPTYFNTKFLEDLHAKSRNLDLIFSFERLYKGNISALIIYGPADLLRSFPELDLQELEDYTDKIDIVNVSSWEIRAKRKPSTGLKQARVEPQFLRHLNLPSETQIYYQIVCQGLGKEKGTLLYQTHMRLAVISSDISIRSKIAKELDLKVSREGVYTREASPRTSSQIFNAYKKRNIKPKEVGSFKVGADELVNLLKQ